MSEGETPQLLNPAATVPERAMRFKVMQIDLDKSEVTLWLYGPDGRYYCDFTFERWPFDDQVCGSILPFDTFLQCLTKTKA